MSQNLVSEALIATSQTAESSAITVLSVYGSPSDVKFSSNRITSVDLMSAVKRCSIYKLLYPRSSSKTDWTPIFHTVDVPVYSRIVYSTESASVLVRLKSVA